MDNTTRDMNRELMLDGNAVAGMFYELFSREMTTTPAECAHCGNKAEMGALHAYTQGPGVVLRCPGCQGIILRMVLTDDAVYLDARGAAYIRIARHS